MRGKPARLAALLAGSAALAALLEGLGLPAGLLLGPMIAAIVLASRDRGITVPPPLFQAGQAIVGILIARSITAAILRTVAGDPWLFGGITAATLGIAVAIGWLLARWQVLPGSVAVWGSMPGAATAMTLMARDAGADWQLVAVMSYLRVVCVAGTASVLAAVIAGHVGAHAAGGGWFPPIDAVRLGETVAIALAGAVGARWIGLPAAALLGPMALAAELGIAGLATPQLPGWLLTPAYALVGWRIGLSFTPEVARTAIRAAPRLLVTTGALMLFCAGLAVLLAHWTGKDMLTAYLATSPGGADSVAIIASSTPVDVPFVMAMQVLRFLAVLVVGPPLARAIAARFPDRDKADATR